MFLKCYLVWNPKQYMNSTLRNINGFYLVTTMLYTCFLSYIYLVCIIIYVLYHISCICPINTESKTALNSIINQAMSSKKWLLSCNNYIIHMLLRLYLFSMYHYIYIYIYYLLSVFKTQSKKLSVLLPWISNHKHKTEGKFKKSSQSSSKVVCFGLTDWQ